MSNITKLIPIVALVLTTSCGGGGGGGDPTEVFRTCGINGGPLRIMPLGDSITEAESGYSSYRFNLWAKLITSGCNPDFVGSRTGVSLGSKNSAETDPANPNFDQNHEGHWGFRADEILNLASDAANAHDPHIVLIHLGTNDIFQRASTGESDTDVVTNVIAEIGAIIDAFRAKNSRVRFVLAGVIRSTTDNSILASLNSQLPGLVTAKNTADSPVIFVDQAAGFSASTDTYDGVHPNLGGEEKMGQKWFDAIQTWVD